MIKTGLIDSGHLNSLKKALDVYSQRHQVTAQNISNVQTTGYRTQEVKFEDLISSADHRLRGRTTREGHLSLGRRDARQTQQQMVETESNFDNGINNVDIDEQMTELATTDLSYRLATRLLSMKYAGLKKAIIGRVI